MQYCRFVFLSGLSFAAKVNFKYVVASLLNLYLHLCLRIFTFSEMTHFVKYCEIVGKVTI